MTKLADKKALNIQASENNINQDIPGSINGIDNNGNTGKDIKNLSTVTKSAKSKKSDLVKAKKLNFAKINSFKTDFFTPKAKKAFIYLQKIFIKVLIFYDFNH